MVNTAFMLPVKGSTMKGKTESCKVSALFGVDVGAESKTVKLRDFL